MLGDYGKPWFTLEGFQVVIKAQVEFLMKIGIDPAIKVVIYAYAMGMVLIKYKNAKVLYTSTQPQISDNSYLNTNNSAYHKTLSNNYLLS